jgi:hypothetical protein
MGRVGADEVFGGPTLVSELEVADGPPRLLLN